VRGDVFINPARTLLGRPPPPSPPTPPAARSASRPRATTSATGPNRSGWPRSSSKAPSSCSAPRCSPASTGRG